MTNATDRAQTPPYDMTMKVSLPMDEALRKVTDALQAEGFGILTEIDVQATLKKKLDIDGRPYRILGACNPTLAHRAIEAEPEIGVLLPCGVVVRETDDGAIISIMDPSIMARMTDNPDIHVIAQEAHDGLKRVAASIMA